jgi:uncharacterized protein (TIGR00730 family)
MAQAEGAHLKSITVFCGSSSGKDKIYQTAATQLGETLAKNNIELIYGGAMVGLMGAVADAVLGAGGRVTGVLPRFLQRKEVAHASLSELILVETMHERKKIMHELCDGVIALPGGFGTLEEFFEVLTWGQLGLHQKPMGLLNTGGFYDSLIGFIQTMVDKGFLKEINRDMILVSDNIDDLLDRMRRYKAPVLGKWIKEEEL